MTAVAGWAAAVLADAMGDADDHALDLARLDLDRPATPPWPIRADWEITPAGALTRARPVYTPGAPMLTTAPRVGDPDPTDLDSETQPCDDHGPDGFYCTADRGHHGPHYAGTGETVVAVWKDGTR